MKKHNRFLLGLIFALLLAALTVPAMAHGGHHSRRAVKTDYPVCTVETCQRTYAHDHDGATYCGHTRGDGHEQHAACAVSGCANLGEHTHRSAGRCGRGRHC